MHNSKQAPRQFAHPILDRMTYNHPSSLVIVYLPIVLVCLIQASYTLTISHLTLTFFLGLFVWTFAEYIMHRFVFHYIPSNSKWERINPLFYGVYIHKIHHAYPRDKKILVMPLIISLPVCLLFFLLFKLILAQASLSFFAGFLLGYLCYDIIHYCTHRYPLPTRLGKFIKFYHMRHHYFEKTKCFGVSNPFWDHLFKTTPNKDNLKKILKE